jgi:glyoxylase-like metal-dependent hydrolase (beta-lactamase superfamily II)
VPGHSKGHTVLLYDRQFLFTGDHLARSEYLQHLHAFRNFCWYSWTEQINKYIQEIGKKYQLLKSLGLRKGKCQFHVTMDRFGRVQTIANG